MTSPSGQRAHRLAGDARRSRSNTEPPSRTYTRTPLTPRPSALPVPLTPDDLNITGRAVAVHRLATERILPTLVAQHGDERYKQRRSDGVANKYRQFLAAVLEERNAGAVESDWRLYEADLCAFLHQLASGTVARSIPEIEALESRYEGECNALTFEMRRRIANGEQESPAMYDALAQAAALHISHLIELFGAWQTRASQLRAADKASVSLKVER